MSAALELLDSGRDDCDTILVRLNLFRDTDDHSGNSSLGVKRSIYAIMPGTNIAE
jgi:hypothetical protein